MVIVTRGELVSAVQHHGGGVPDVSLGYQGSRARDKLIGMISIGDLVKAVIEEQQQTIVQLERYIAG